MTTNNTYDVEKQILFRDGVVQLTGLLDSDDLSELNNAIDDNINRPSPFGTQMQKDASGGKFFMDFNNFHGHRRFSPIWAVFLFRFKWLSYILALFTLILVTFHW